MIRVKRGMSLEEVAALWRTRTEAMTRSTMDKYYRLRSESGSGGREGLGVYGTYKDRVARDKVRLAVKMLGQAGLPVTESSIRKVTGQSTSTISRYWWPPRPVELDLPPDSGPLPPTIKFPLPDSNSVRRL